ncbi:MULTISPECIES: hypothetical protein [unclassified Microcoleus]
MFPAQPVLPTIKLTLCVCGTGILPVLDRDARYKIIGNPNFRACS